MSHGSRHRGSYRSENWDAQVRRCLSSRKFTRTIGLRALSKMSTFDWDVTIALQGMVATLAASSPPIMLRSRDAIR